MKLPDLQLVREDFLSDTDVMASAIERGARTLWGRLVVGASCESPQECGTIWLVIVAQFTQAPVCSVSHSIMRDAAMLTVTALCQLLSRTPPAIWNDRDALESHKRLMIDEVLAAFEYKMYSVAGKKLN